MAVPTAFFIWHREIDVGSFSDLISLAPFPCAATAAAVLEPCLPHAPLAGYHVGCSSDAAKHTATVLLKGGMGKHVSTGVSVCRPSSAKVARWFVAANNGQQQRLCELLAMLQNGRSNRPDAPIGAVPLPLALWKLASESLSESV